MKKSKETHRDILWQLLCNAGTISAGISILYAGSKDVLEVFFWRKASGRRGKEVKLKWKWLPSWNMPSDPVKAVFWFLHWFLQVLVRYFYIPILGGVAYETYLNGIVGFAGTLFVGLLVWAGLAVLLMVVKVSSGVSQVYSEVHRLRQNPYGFADFMRPAPEPEENVVEGSIITDLEEERKRRRQEM